MKSLTYIGASVSAAAYAVWLELRPRKYHPDVTWPNVTAGIALTGAWVAARFAFERRPRSLAWAWRQMLWMFCATGAPVVAWELAAKSRRGRALLAYLRRRRNGDPAPTAAAEHLRNGQKLISDGLRLSDRNPDTAAEHFRDAQRLMMAAENILLRLELGKFDD